jgi:hypothetical protein
MKKLEHIIVNSQKAISKEELGEIEPLTIASVYKDETFFSIFAEHGTIYEVVYD